MNRIGVAFFAFLGFAHSASSGQLPVEVYGALPLVSEVVISPDGTRVALARNEKDGSQSVHVVDISTGEVIELTYCANGFTHR